MSHFLGFKVKQIDTHVKGMLTECQIDRCGRMSDRRVIRDYIVFPKEIFLSWCIKRVIAKEAIERDPGFSHFEAFYRTLIHPTDLKIGGEYKTHIERYRALYEVTIAVLAVEERAARVDISIHGSWNYAFGQFVVDKSLVEGMIRKLGAAVVFPTVWTDIQYRLEKLKPQIEFSALLRPFKPDIVNAINVILNSPVTVSFSNTFRMLAPNVEGILKAYIAHKGVRGIRTDNLGQMVGKIATYNGPEFSREFGEYLKIVLDPMRNLSLHGGLPSESVCNFLTVVVMELIEEILRKE
jgi:hypothetical protein